MPHFPLSGAIPLNMQKSMEKAATSYRSGSQFEIMYRDQYTDPILDPRNPGCEILRRYPNGELAFNYVADKVMELIHKNEASVPFTEMEKAILCLVLPQQFMHLVDPKIAQTMTKLSNDERLMLGLIVQRRMLEELNYNAGRGGGSVPGRAVTRV